MPPEDIVSLQVTSQYLKYFKQLDHDVDSTHKHASSQPQQPM